MPKYSSKENKIVSKENKIDSKENKPYHKATIPKALREQVWLKTCGKVYEHKCYVHWCKNKITVYDFHVGHDIPESKGGTLDINNLEAICSRCNSSMSDNYTIEEWAKLSGRKRSCLSRFFCYFWC